MDPNEDEPEDVQNATPVEEDVKTGEKDETKEKGPKKVRKAKPTQKCVKKPVKMDKPDKEKDCCKNKIQKMKRLNTMNICIYDKPPCLVAPKYENPKRHCLSKQSYINFLAEPKPRCPDEVKKQVTRKVRMTTQRTRELAIPSKIKVMSNLQEGGCTLPPELVDNLIHLIEGEHALTPEQAEKLFRDKAQATVKCKKKPRRKSCPSKSNRKRGQDLFSPSMNVDAVMCEYMMAEQFVKSILEWKCPIPREDYRDVSTIILKRLSAQLQYTVADNVDRKSQQMRFLADIIACWISGILMEVAELHKAELEDELRRRLEERQHLLEELEFADEMLQKDGGYDSDQDDQDQYLSEEESEVFDKDTDTDGLLGMKDICNKTDETVCADAATEVECGDVGGGIEADETSDDISCVTDMGTDPTGPKTDDKYICTDDKAAREAELARQRELARLKDKMTGITDQEIGGQFKTHIPFVTFVKIVHTIYSMVESEPENLGDDPVENHLHRAIYEKFEGVLLAEDPDIITEHVRDVVDVVTGKVAKWLKAALTASEVCFLSKYPAEVESNEVRDWACWMDSLTCNAEHWAKWLQKVVQEICQMNQKNVTRGDWNDWTKLFECQSLRWRRYRLEATHIGHHTDIMIKDRTIVKTGQRNSPEYYERLLREMNLDVESLE